MSDERTSGPAAQGLTARQQLEASLAAGTLTPELFATLSAQLPPEPPAAPPAPAKPAFSPSGNDAELPSLLDMFNQPPAASASPPPPGVPPAQVAQPAPASPPHPSAADATARRLIEERLTQIRQRPAELSTAPPAPTRTPTFYPETPAPTPAATPVAAPAFYPTTPESASSPPVPPRQASPRPSAPQAQPASSNVGKWLLVLLFFLAVAGAGAYFFIQNSHPDESLTSPSLPAAEPAATEVAAPKPAKKTKKSTKKKRKKKESAPVATAAEVEVEPEQETTAPASQPAAVAATPTPTSVRAVPTTSQPLAAAPEASDDAAATKVREALAAYYADLNAPPLHASQHFAPQVERLYIQQNLTPAAIDAELARSFFPENQQAVARIAPGTLRVSAPAADGSRTATFTEDMRLYRVSKQQFQRLRTNVRVRFNTDYQITYMRQEKLLANTFE